MAEEKKLDKITITRGVVFDREPRNVGDVCAVTDSNRHAAEVLVATGKAVAGEVKKSGAAANKAVTAADIERK